MAHLDPELLSAYIDHELSQADMAAVERHLADCGACRAEFAELRGLATLVRELPVYEPRRVIDVSAYPRGGSETLARIIAFSKPLAIAAVVLLVAFAGLRLLNDDDPDDGGDQISFSAVQPTEAGTEMEGEASEEQAADAPAAGVASDSEPLGEAPPMSAMPARQAQTAVPTAMDATQPAPAEVAATAEPAQAPAPAGRDDEDGWLPVAIVSAIVVALAGVAGWYRFIRKPGRRRT